MPLRYYWPDGDISHNHPKQGSCFRRASISAEQTAPYYEGGRTAFWLVEHINCPTTPCGSPKKGATCPHSRKPKVASRDRAGSDRQFG